VTKARDEASGQVAPGAALLAYQRRLALEQVRK